MEEDEAVLDAFGEEGMRPRAIAERLGVEYSRVLEILHHHYGSLRKRETDLSHEDLDLIVAELAAQLPLKGYRKITEFLRATHGILVGQHRVRASLQRIWPAAVAARQLGRRRIVRGLYEVPGSNFQWHLDCNQKLLPLGNINIHMLVDGFSRKILYAFVAANKSADTVEAAFDWATIHYGHPVTLRTDRGMENVKACARQTAFWANKESRAPPVRQGSSVHNTRVERLNKELNDFTFPWKVQLVPRLGPLLDVGSITPDLLFAVHEVLLPRIQLQLNTWVGVQNRSRIRNGPIPNAAFRNNSVFEPAPGPAQDPTSAEVMEFWRAQEHHFLWSDPASERWPAAERQHMYTPELVHVRQLCQAAAKQHDDPVDAILAYQQCLRQTMGYPAATVVV